MTIYRLKNYTSHVQVTLQKEHEEKVNEIVKFYQKEMKELLKQFNNARIDVMKANKIMTKLISVNYR